MNEKKLKIKNWYSNFPHFLPLVKTSEETWNQILRLHKSEDYTTKSSEKKTLRLFSENLEDCSENT